MLTIIYRGKTLHIHNEELAHVDIDACLKDIKALEAENRKLKKAIEDFGKNPAGFDWGVLDRIDQLEEVLDWIIGVVETDMPAKTKFLKIKQCAEQALKEG